MRAKEDEIRKERERLENVRKQMELDQKREKEQGNLLFSYFVLFH
jgi:hypothetical protein